MEPEKSTSISETPFISELKEILRKYINRGISVDIILGCPDLYPLSTNSFWIDITHCRRGRFALVHPVDDSLPENMEDSLRNFSQSWKRWIAPNLLINFHNVVVFEVFKSYVVSSEGKFDAVLNFKWMNMECKFPGNKEKGNGLYVWPTPTPPVMSLAPIRFLKSYGDLIAMCDPVTQKSFLEGEWNLVEMPCDGVPSETSYIK